MSRGHRWLLVPALLVLAAAAPPPRPAPAAPPRVVEVTVAPGGEMRFEPADITARPGDVVRFVAFSGVHNVHFTRVLNPGAAALPQASGWLLRTGDAYELKVDLAPGTYRFQCDPHARMGMTGVLVVSG